MRAAHVGHYGTPDVVTLVEVAEPTPGPRDVLISVRAGVVTQGDRRLRSGDFPGITWLVGRLMMGITGPRKTTPGTSFAGRVVAVGPEVTRFRPGDDVFGSSMHGAWAERLVIPEDGPLAPLPPGMGYEEAASVPYGGVTALTFLRDLGQLKAGERVLVVGASGGVGRFAVQIAKHMGAEVTGVCSARTAPLAREAGADRVLDHQAGPYLGQEVYDVIFDTVDALTLGEAKASLNETGRFLSLHITTRLIVDLVVSNLRQGPRAVFGVAVPTPALLLDLAALMRSGAVRPFVDRVYPLDEVVEANRRLESGQALGTVAIRIQPADAPRLAAA